MQKELLTTPRSWGWVGVSRIWAQAVWPQNVLPDPLWHPPETGSLSNSPHSPLFWFLFSEFRLVDVSDFLWSLSLWMWSFTSPQEQYRWGWGGWGTPSLALFHGCLFWNTMLPVADWTSSLVSVEPRGLLLDQLWLSVSVYSNKTLERVIEWHFPTFNQRLGETWLESFILGIDNPQEKFSLQDGGKKENGWSNELGSKSHAVACAHTSFHFWGYF